MVGRVFDDIAVTIATIRQRRRTRGRPDVFRKRVAWALAPLLATVVLCPPSAAADETQGPAAEATASDELFKLTAPDGTPLNHFGNDVAVSGDTVVVGAPKMHWSAVTGAGAAYVFRRSGDSWVQQAKLTASDGVPGDRFGWSVAISGDTIVVGAMWDDVGTNVDQGSAYVFTRTAETWTEQGKVTASNGVARAEFGISVAVSGGDVAVGAMSLADDLGVPPQGSAWVFTQNGGRWTEQAELIPSDGVIGDGFGFRVDIDGDTAVVGAPRGEAGEGSAYVFGRTGQVWTQQKILDAGESVVSGSFGFWVGLDDDTIVVGDPEDGDGRGAAYVFTRTGGHWAEQEKLTASDGVGRAGNAKDGDYFGRSVAVSGNTVVVGAQFDDVGPQNNDGQGSAYVFKRTGTGWSESVHLTAPDGAAGDLFGVSVGVSGDTAVIGASFALVDAAQGAAYAWRDPTYRTRPDKSFASSTPPDPSDHQPAESETGFTPRPPSPSPAASPSPARTSAAPSTDVNEAFSGSHRASDGAVDERLVGRAIRHDRRHSTIPARWAIPLLAVIALTVLVRRSVASNDGVDAVGGHGHPRIMPVGRRRGHAELGVAGGELLDD